MYYALKVMLVEFILCLLKSMESTVICILATYLIIYFFSSFCFVFVYSVLFLLFYPNLFDLQSKTPSPKTSINNNNNNEKPQAPVSLDFLRSVPKSTPTTTGTSGSYQYQMRRRLVNWSKKPIQCLSICHILIKFRFCTVF